MWTRAGNPYRLAGPRLRRGNSSAILTRLTGRRWCGNIGCLTTTLDIEADGLQAAKEMAQRKDSTTGAIISRLARRGLKAATPNTGSSTVNRNGVPIFPSRGEIITSELVQALMDEEGI
jgi:hypothetical protein